MYHIHGDDKDSKIQMDNNMPKILILNYEYPPLGGGGGRVSHSLAKGFTKKGYSVDVITSKFGNLPHCEVVDGIHIYRVPIIGREKLQTATFLSMFSFLFTACLQGLILCIKNRYQFINTHFVLPTGPLGFVLSKLFHVKNILSIHGGDISDPSEKRSPHNHLLLRKIIHFLLNQAHQVVAQSTNTRQNAMRYYQPKRKIHVIPLSYEPYSFLPKSRSELGLDANRVYLISIGRIVKRKGFDYLIRSLALLDEHIVLLIIGDGSGKSKLKQIVARLNLQHRVNFMGDIPEETKFQYLAVSDLYVLSSLHEGFGIVLQEAMQVGLPIVSTNCGGQLDIVADGINGILVDPCNESALADAVMQVLNHPELASQMSANNTKALAKYRTDSIIDQYIELI